MDIEAELARLKSLFDKGLIDEAEYREEKKALLSSLRTSSASSPSITGGGQKTAIGISDEVSLFLAGSTIGPDDRPYKLDKRLGAGGMGQVWRALDIKESESLDREVWKAIKILPVTAESDLSQYKALKQEAYLVEQLRHPHIISVSGWREDKITGMPFIVMEWLQGNDLGTVLAQEGDPGLPYQRVIELLAPVVEALDYAWKKHQLVHRDLKPANLFLTDTGEIKLLDFGIAARIGKTATSIGIKGREQAGTPGYRPPEARAKRKPAPSWDVYGMGALTYQLLAGEAPFGEDRAPYTPQPDAPESLNEAQWQVLQKAFAFEEEQRYPGVKEYWQAIRVDEGPSAEEIERQNREEAGRAAAVQAAEAENAANKGREEVEQEEAARALSEIEARCKAEEEAKRQTEARIQEEKHRRDKTRWQISSNTIEGYRQYLKEAESDYRLEEAKEKLQKLEEAKAKEEEANKPTYENIIAKLKPSYPRDGRALLLALKDICMTESEFDILHRCLEGGGPELFLEYVPTESSNGYTYTTGPDFSSNSEQEIREIMSTIKVKLSHASDPASRKELRRQLAEVCGSLWTVSVPCNTQDEFLLKSDRLNTYRRVARVMIERMQNS